MVSRNKNVDSFRAAFLDGIRGLAALSVVYSHSQNLFDQKLPYTTYNNIGFDGVRYFFVLSAFLLTLRGILEWEVYLEKRDAHNNSEEQGVNDEESVKEVIILENKKKFCCQFI